MEWRHCRKAYRLPVLHRSCRAAPRGKSRRWLAVMDSWAAVQSLTLSEIVWEASCQRGATAEPDPRRPLQNFNVSSWLRLGTAAQNWNLNPGGSPLTGWLLCSLSGGLSEREGFSSPLSAEYFPSIKTLGSKQLTSTSEERDVSERQRFSITRHRFAKDSAARSLVWWRGANVSFMRGHLIEDDMEMWFNERRATFIFSWPFAPRHIYGGANSIVRARQWRRPSFIPQ